MLNIASLNPDQFRIDLRVKVIELVVSLKTKHEQCNVLPCPQQSNVLIFVDLADVIIHIYEYLVGDDTGCIVLNTKSGTNTPFCVEQKSYGLQNCKLTLYTTLSMLILKLWKAICDYMLLISNYHLPTSQMALTPKTTALRYSLQESFIIRESLYSLDPSCQPPLVPKLLNLGALCAIEVLE